MAFEVEGGHGPWADGLCDRWCTSSHAPPLHDTAQITHVAEPEDCLELGHIMR